MGELAVTSKNEAPTSPFGIAASNRFNRHYINLL